MFVFDVNEAGYGVMFCGVEEAKYDRLDGGLKIGGNEVAEVEADAAEGHAAVCGEGLVEGGEVNNVVWENGSGRVALEKVEEEEEEEEAKGRVCGGGGGGGGERESMWRRRKCGPRRMMD
ncbi:hypothetical protein BC936DRAFT_137905 [Jimgerdemannia flammicorona]|uniref:Uncharacterized protein n=1 Tax=Jimgerdemannia flammicorona TaxID=994334 RepID=A0A433DIP8_9FUNG|nr:hypothetical protein BC936DRAFT_137905 [Jimgerdemannia flammicorona]